MRSDFAKHCQTPRDILGRLKVATLDSPIVVFARRVPGSRERWLTAGFADTVAGAAAVRRWEGLVGVLHKGSPNADHLLRTAARGDAFKPCVPSSYMKKWLVDG